MPIPFPIGGVIRSQGRTITEADVLMFSTLTGDMHPLHTDAEWVKANSPFGSRIAPGMMLLSYAFGLLPVEPTRVVALRRLRNVVFKRAVRFGETVVAEAKLEEFTPINSDTGLATMRLGIVVGEETAVKGEIQLIWRHELHDGDGPHAGDGG